MTPTSSDHGPTRRSSRATKRAPRRGLLLVPVPGSSPIHRLWAGTKLLVVLWFSILLWFYPGWVMIGMVWVLVLAAARVAHVPRGALPSRPRRLWILIALAVIFASLAGGSPVISVGGVDIELGGALYALRAALLAFGLIGLAAMVSWTTQVAEIVPAITTLARPFTLLRIPVREWAVALALGLRAFPMLIEEFQILYAAHRLRSRQMQLDRKLRRRQQARDVIDLIAAALAMTLRRADEMGDAITARGGTGQFSAVPARPKLADWVTLAIAAAAGGGAIAVETVFHISQWA
ncbi:CbiQ family ECF transporter T component [Mycobacterium neumannii]|uniref:CbiQ family ECF transporter T component n=1 Tax=Mycobacterium neumannii TaxID=2048551 RepID=UPI003AB33EDB